MYVSSIKALNNTAKSTISKVLKPISGVVEHSLHAQSPAVFGISALSGAYLAGKSLQNKSERLKELEDLNLNDDVKRKILNAKNENGNYIFNKQGIKLLKEVQNVKDYAMFSFIIKNIDYIDKIEKEKKPSFGTEIVTYNAHANTPEGEKKASITVTNNGAVTIFESNNYKKDGTPFKEERICDDTILSQRKSVYFGEKENITYDNFKQLLTTEKTNGNGQLEYVKNTSLNKRDVIESVFKRNFETSNPKNVTTEVVDFKNKIKMSVLEEKTDLKSKYNAKYNALKEIRTYINSQTGRKETLTMEMSEVPGVYNSVITDDLGNKRIESFGKINSDGSVVVEKHLQSLDGTMTNYTYNASKDEFDVVMHYDIKTADGKPLTTVDRSFKRVNPNLAYSSINGHYYVIRNFEDAVEVEDKFNNKTTRITYDEFFTYTQDLNRRELLNKMSGDMLLDMYNKKYSYTHVDDIFKSGMSPSTKEIEAQDDIFTFAHELGHAKDVEKVSEKTSDNNGLQNNIASNPLFINTFKAERRQFREKFPKLEQEYVSYFINTLLRGSEETIAETNALFSTGLPNAKGDFTRVYYLQKYFPRTIAVLSSLLNTNSNIYVGK